MTKLKLLMDGLIAATLLIAHVMARENHTYARHIVTKTDGSAAAGARYIDRHLCYPAPRVGAFATQPWDNSPPCEPTLAY
jgi:hypothetical protein